MAIVVDKNNYYINELFDDNANKYYLCMPKNNELEYEIFFGFSKDNMGMDEIISMISSIYDEISANNKQIIYLSVNTESASFREAVDENDDKLYDPIYGVMKSVFKHAYNFIIKEKIARINQVITAIKIDDDDVKFINWLETKREMFGYIRSISLNNIRNKEVLLLDSTDDGGGAVLSGLPEGDSLSENKGFVKKKVPKNNHGFGNISFIFLVLAISFIVGIGVAYMVINK